MKFRALLATMTVLFAAAIPAAAEGPRIGQLKTVSGEVTILRDSARLSVKPGDAVYTKDIVQTGEHGSVGITFVDNCWDYNKGRSELRVGVALDQGDNESDSWADRLDESCVTRLAVLGIPDHKNVEPAPGRKAWRALVPEERTGGGKGSIAWLEWNLGGLHGVAHSSAEGPERQFASIRRDMDGAAEGQGPGVDCQINGIQKTDQQARQDNLTDTTGTGGPGRQREQMWWHISPL